MAEQKIPGRQEWSKLSAVRLYEVRSDMIDLHYKMRQSGASFAAHYQKFISELDQLIASKEAAEQAEKERERAENL